MHEFRIEGMLDKRMADQISIRVRSEVPGIKFEVGPCITIKGFTVGIEALTVIGGIAGIIQALVALWSIYDRSRQQSTWTYDRAISIIKNELATRQVTDFSVEAIEGFEHLLSRDGKSCIWRLKDKNLNIDYEMLMFGDGKVYVIRLK